LLLSESPTLIHELNAICQEGRRKWEQADIDYISPAISVNGYMDYIISDNDPVQGVVVKKGCPFQVRGLAYYNWIRQTKNLAGEPLYGGKMKYYIVRQRTPKKKTDSDIIFTFQPSSLPKWSEQYAPIDRRAMFQKCVLDPINRILTCMHEKNLNWDGHIDINLFDL
jgi:hypothetical protein